MIKQTILYLLFLFFFNYLFSQKKVSSCWFFYDAELEKAITSIIDRNSNIKDSVFIYQKTYYYKIDITLVIKKPNKDYIVYKLIQADDKKELIQIKKLISKEYFIPNISKLYTILNSKENFLSDSLGTSMCEEGHYFFWIKYGSNCLYREIACYEFDNMALKYNWGCLLLRKKNDKYFKASCK